MGENDFGLAQLYISFTVRVITEVPRGISTYALNLFTEIRLINPVQFVRTKTRLTDISNSSPEIQKS